MSDWKETMMGRDHCPRCGKMCDAASDPKGEDVPKPGDISVCVYCAAILQFSDDMALIDCPLAVLEELDAEAQFNLFKYRAAILDMKNIRA